MVWKAEALYNIRHIVTLSPVCISSHSFYLTKLLHWEICSSESETTVHGCGAPETDNGHIVPALFRAFLFRGAICPLAHRPQHQPPEHNAHLALRFSLNANFPGPRRPPRTPRSRLLYFIWKSGGITKPEGGLTFCSETKPTENIVLITYGKRKSGRKHFKML